MFVYSYWYIEYGYVCDAAYVHIEYTYICILYVEFIFCVDMYFMCILYIDESSIYIYRL